MMHTRDFNIRAAVVDDWPSVRALLESDGLPLDGAEQIITDILVAERNSCIVGCTGLETYGDAALLRSCAVDEAHRGEGMGRELIRQTIHVAISRGVRELFLLTTTAEYFFSGLGFQRVARDEIADAVKASQEFHGACPASACAMRLAIDGNSTKL